MKLLRSGATVFALLLAIGAITAGDVPWSDDARFYVRSAIEHGRWLQRVMQLDVTAFGAQAVQRSFEFNAEHPSVAKMLMGLGWLIFHEWTGVLSEIEACRAAVLILWALMGAAVFVLCRDRMSLASAWVAALSLSAMPRLLYHAHAETLDVPVAAMMTFSALAIFETLEHPRWRTGFAAVVLFGLALATKLNAPFLLVSTVVYWLLIARVQTEDKRWLRLPPVPLVLLGLLILSPLIAWAVWPWIWFDTVARLQAYVMFHLKHYGIYFYYAGVLYGEDIAPPSAPFVLTALTLPVPLLMLAAMGSLRPLRRMIGLLPFASGFDPEARAHTRADRLALFALLIALVQLFAVSLPTVPKYGGVKLFVPMLPFVAILIAYGFEKLVTEAQRHTRGARALTVATALIVLAPGWLGAAVYSGTWLSYYNSLGGGVRGATESGHERQYYDLAYPQLARALQTLLPDGGGVAIVPNPKEYTPHFARWQKSGALSRKIRRAAPERADLLVITHERRWEQYPHLLAQYRNHPLVHQFAHSGVPLFSIYELRGDQP